MIGFVVLGRPQPAGSKRAFAVRKGGRLTGAVAVVETAEKRVRPWQALIRDAALQAMQSQELLDGALILEVDFYLARPRSHYRTGRHSEQLRDAAPSYPTTRPDATKLLRGLEDALTGIVWRDDAQIVTQVARKRYGTPERADVLVDHAYPNLSDITPDRQYLGRLFASTEEEA